MLDYDTAIELMKKYGYSSTTHPYIYQNDDTIGICYTYDDEDFGQLERIRIFDKAEDFELFLKQMTFVKNNGRKFHIRMILDNYESTNPKVLFLRNEKLMVEGEMFDIQSFDAREAQRNQMDDVSKLIYEAGDLLLIYDEIKGRQLQYLNNIIGLKNSLREKYFELQKEVDIYNKYKVERHLTLLSDVNDIGIDDNLEISIKDKYNIYVVQLPTYEEAAEFLKEVWDLNKNLELNTKYYEAQKDELDTRNELKVVERKLDLMKKLNEDLKPFFRIDLTSKFRKINKACSYEMASMSSEAILENINRTARKYSVFEHLDLLYTSDYLREAIQNTNYADLAIKYSKNANKDFLHSYRIPPNEVAASLSVQYRDKLDVSEQAILVIYNNHKYRKMCNAILDIKDFDTLPVKKVISKISGINGFSKIKSECYDAVKRRLESPVNANIKQSLFAEYDFTTFDTFIESLIKQLVKLRNINNKMILSGDINMYLLVRKPEDISSRKFVMVTNDLTSLLVETKESKEMVGITLLKKNTPVLFSPYYLDIGDLYSKDSLEMSIKEMINFELLVEISDILINIDPVKINVVRYTSEPFVVENVSVVDDLKMNFKTTFCKFAFTNGLNEAVPELAPVSASDISSAPLSTNVENGSGGAVNPVVDQVVPASEPVVQVSEPVVQASEPVSTPVLPTPVIQAESPVVEQPSVPEEGEVENKPASLDSSKEDTSINVSKDSVSQNDSNSLKNETEEHKEVTSDEKKTEVTSVSQNEEPKVEVKPVTEKVNDVVKKEEVKEISKPVKDKKNVEQKENNSQSIVTPVTPVKQEVKVEKVPESAKVQTVINKPNPPKENVVVNKVPNGATVNSNPHNNANKAPTMANNQVKKEVKVGVIGKPVAKQVVKQVGQPVKIGQPVKSNNINNK